MSLKASCLGARESSVTPELETAMPLYRCPNRPNNKLANQLRAISFRSVGFILLIALVLAPVDFYSKISRL